MDDITPILEHWPYVPDDITVRIIEGRDGSKKVQMRLDLGLLQMEYTGRPDGKRPHGCDSLLEYYQDQLKKHIERYGSDESFFLDPDDCSAMRGEALQYYYRYLSLFHLKHYDVVERDTARNLKVFKFIRKYAAEEEDRFALEQYRPYVIMMNTRAKGYLLLDDGRTDEALRCVDEGVRKIQRFFKEFGRPKLAERCSEMVLLKKFKNEIKSTRQENPVEQLRQKMQDAISREDYESAAYFRDEIKRLTQHKT